MRFIYIPKDQRKSLLLRVYRIDLSHLRFEKMYQFLRLRYYWERMTNDIKEILESCSMCARMSAEVPFQPLRPIESFYPFQRVSLDTAHVVRGNTTYYFIVGVDHFTRWVEAQFIGSATSENVIKFILENIVYWHGCPAYIQTNGGKPYVSQAIETFLSRYDIKHSVTAAYHPESNGLAEKTIKTIKAGLSKLLIQSTRD